MAVSIKQVALKEPAETAALLLEAIRDYAIYMLDSTGHVTSWNEGARRLKGYEAEEVLGKSFTIFYLPEDIANGHPQHELDIARTQGHYEEENWRVRKDGSRFWAHVTLTRIDDSRGHLLGFAKITQDLTERMRNEAVLREAKANLEKRVQERTAELQLNENRFRQIIELSPFPVAMLDRDMRYIYASQSWIKVFRVATENLQGKSHYDVFPNIPEHRKEIHRHCLSGATARNEEEPFPREDGSIDWFRWEIRPWYRDTGEIGGILIYTEDVSERRKMAESIKSNERQLQALANTIPQLVWMAHGDGFVFWYNQRWYEYTGATPVQMEGWGWESVHDPQYLPEVIERWQKSLRGGEPFEMEFPLRGSDGKFRWFLTRVVPVRDSQGQVMRWFGTSTEIDELKRTRDQLEQALGARDEFLSIASHELKTPLSALKMQLQMAQMRQDHLVEEELKKIFDMCVKQTDALTSLVNLLLDISRVQNGQFVLSRKELSLSDLVSDVIGRFREQLAAAHIEVSTEVETGVVGCWDRSRIEQVVTNLLSNALKYAPNSAVKVSLKRLGSQAELIVQDAGPGIAIGKQIHLFERFDRAGLSDSNGGLGLGLFIVKQIVDAHGGHVSLESEPGKGTRVSVRLPL